MNELTIKQIVEKVKSALPHVVREEAVFFGEATITVEAKHLIEALTYLKEQSEPRFDVLTDLTATDYLEPEPRSRVIYWLHAIPENKRLRVAVWVKREETIPTIIPLWAGANWYERELFDLFGIGFDGHPDLKRIFLPGEWEGYPLRKDYALTEEPVEFKHGVKPKVPSKVIPHVGAKRPKYSS